MNQDWVLNYFRTVDTMQPQKIAENFAADARFRFGSQEPATGKTAIVAALTEFFGTIKTMRHKPLKIWVDQDSAVCEAEVAYGDRDGEITTLPVASILRFENEKIVDYRIDMDVSPVFAKQKQTHDKHALKYFAVLRRPPEMSETNFRAHWKHQHAPLVAKIPGVVKYVQYHVRTQTRPDYKPQDDPINGIVELWFESKDAFKAAQNTKEFQAVVQDEHAFLGDTDHFNHSLEIVETVEVVNKV